MKLFLHDGIEIDWPAVEDARETLAFAASPLASHPGTVAHDDMEDAVLEAMDILWDNHHRGVVLAYIKT
jgi:hypothetical protein